MPYGRYEQTGHIMRVDGMEMERIWSSYPPHDSVNVSLRGQPKMKSKRKNTEKLHFYIFFEHSQILLFLYIQSDFTV